MSSTQATAGIQQTPEQFATTTGIAIASHLTESPEDAAQVKTNGPASIIARKCNATFAKRADLHPICIAAATSIAQARSAAEEPATEKSPTEKTATEKTADKRSPTETATAEQPANQQTPEQFAAATGIAIAKYTVDVSGIIGQLTPSAFITNECNNTFEEKVELRPLCIDAGIKSASQVPISGSRTIASIDDEFAEALGRKIGDHLTDLPNDAAQINTNGPVSVITKRCASVFAYNGDREESCIYGGTHEDANILAANSMKWSGCRIRSSTISTAPSSLRNGKAKWANMAPGP